MADTSTSGVATALDTAKSGDGAQLSMLAGDETARAEAVAPDADRGPGRPKGARNKQTKRAAKLFLTKHADPLDIAGDFLTEWRADKLEFTAKYGFKNLTEAARFIMATAGAVLPYIHKKQPQEIEAATDGGAAMVLMIPPAQAETGSTGDDIDLENLLMSMPGADPDSDDAIEDVEYEGEENQ